MKRILLACGLAALAACGSDDNPEGSAPDVSQSSTASTQVDGQATTSPPTEPSTTAVPTTIDIASTVPTTPATTVPDTSASTSIPSTSAPPADSGPTDGTALVYASGGDEYAWLPVGWWDGSAWVSPGWPSPGMTYPASTFDALSVASVELDAPIEGVTSHSPTTYSCVDDTDIASFELEIELPEANGWGYRALAVTGDWHVQPRPVTAVGLDSPVYQQVGESLVPTDQPVDPSLGDVIQVLRADLDGDGIEEVLFTFEHRAEPDGLFAPGDFSLVAARYPDAGGSVADDVLFAHVLPTPMEFANEGRSQVMAIADLNGDGTMEVALESTYWESAAVTVYEFSGGRLHEVMRSGCGV